MQVRGLLIYLSKRNGSVWGGLAYLLFSLVPVHWDMPVYSRYLPSVGRKKSWSRRLPEAEMRAGHRETVVENFYDLTANDLQAVSTCFGCKIVIWEQETVTTVSCTGHCDLPSVKVQVRVFGFSLVPVWCGPQARTFSAGVGASSPTGPWCSVFTFINCTVARCTPG